MSQSVRIKGFDLSPKDLFPDIEAANQDERCIVIAEMFQEIVIACDMRSTSRAKLKEDAANKYDFISKESKLTLAQARIGAIELLQMGVSPTTAKKYYSFRLSESDVVNFQFLL